MPNAHGQITISDFVAPAGQFRLMKEDMEDGKLEILADFYNYKLAVDTTTRLQEENPDDVFTLCDGNGPIKP